MESIPSKARVYLILPRTFIEDKMNKIRLVAFLLLLSALGLIAIGFVMGQIEVALLIFVPVLIGEGPLAILGMLLLFASFILFFTSLPKAPLREKSESAEAWEGPTPSEERSKFGGVVFIGPIPIIFGSGKELLKNRYFLIAIIAIATLMLILTLTLLL